MIKLIIADDMEEYRIHFKMLFDGDDEIEVVDVANGENDVIDKVQKLRPDVVLMDIQMDNDISGITATREIMRNYPETKVIMLTIHGSKDNIIMSYEAGAVDFIEKNASPYEIIRLIKDVVGMKKRANNVIVEEYKRLKNERESMLYLVNIMSKLSRSELAIIKAVSEGKKYREIAEDRCCEEVTIRTIASRICAKTGIKPVKEFVESLRRLGILEIVIQMCE